MDSAPVNTTQSQSLKFRCPGCQTVLQAPPQYAGKRVKCNICQQLLQVPGVPPHSSAPLKPKKFIICICGSCKHIFKAPTGDHEHTVKCPSCSHVVEIPTKIDQITDSDTFRFKCKHCQQDYCVLSKYGGKKFTCLACKQSTGIPIPAAPQPQVEVLAPDDFEEPDVLEEDEDVPTYQLQDEPEDQDVIAPPEFDPTLMPASAPRPKTKRKRAARSEQSTSPVLKRFLVPMIMIAVVIVLGGMMAIGTSGPPQDRSAEASQYAESVIRLVHEGDEDSLLYEFYDYTFLLNAENPEQTPLKILIKGMQNTGSITEIESTVEHAQVDHGAAGYVILSTVKYDAAPEQKVELAVFDDLGFLQVAFMNVKDSMGTRIASIGDTEYGDFKKFAVWFVEESKTMSTSVICMLFSGLIALYILTTASMRIVFRQMGYPAWAVFVPIYGPYVGRRVARDMGGLFGFGLWALPFIFYPILAIKGDLD